MAEENKENRSLLYRMFKDVVKADPKTIATRVWKDAIVPGLVRDIKQIVNTAADTTFSDKGVAQAISGAANKKIDYNRVTRTEPPSQQGKIIQNYADFRYATREKAEGILQMMQFNIQATGRYRLDDFFRASGSKEPDWTYRTYGWNDLELVQSAFVEIDPNTDKFIIKNLSKPIYIGQ